MLSVNRIFPLRVLTAGAISLFLNITGAISLFLNITGAIAPVAPVLNTPLLLHTESIPYETVSPGSYSSTDPDNKV